MQPRRTLTERDIVRAIAEEVPLAQTPVSATMTRGPIAIGIDEDLDRAATLMATHRTRHLPVLEKGRVVGMLSIRDVLDAVREAAV